MIIFYYYDKVKIFDFTFKHVAHIDIMLVGIDDLHKVYNT